MAATLSVPPARAAAALLLAVALLAGPSRAARDAEDIEQNSLEPNTEEVQGASPIQHYALDCWRSCGGAGDCAWCGQGNACCLYKSRTDPPECRGVKFWPTLTFHTCVQTVHKALPKPTAKEAAETETPAPEEAKITTTEEVVQKNKLEPSTKVPGPSPIQHYALDCFRECGGAGSCTWCGAGNACCRYKSRTDPPECRGVLFWPVLTFHTCVQTVQKALAAPTVPSAQHSGPSPIQNYALDCYENCGGAGYCAVCGAGNACCRYKSRKDPPECHGVKFWPVLTFHTCVQPAHQAIAKPAAPAATVELPNWAFHHHSERGNFSTDVDVEVSTVVIPGTVVVGGHKAGGKEHEGIFALVNDAGGIAKKALEAVKMPRFITEGTTVFLQDEEGKTHAVSERGCLACGCFYDTSGFPSAEGDYLVLSPEEVAKMPAGDGFSCEEYMPAFAEPKA